MRSRHGAGRRLPTWLESTLPKMLSHLKSRNGYGMADINPRDEDEEKEADVNSKNEEERKGRKSGRATVDESSEAAESPLNSEIEDIEISAEPEPGTDGSTFSEEESEEEEKEERITGEKRKREDDESEGGEEEQESGNVRKAKRNSKGRGWGWLLDEEQEESDSD